jgi:hypothetical protein
VGEGGERLAPWLDRRIGVALWVGSHQSAMGSPNTQGTPPSPGNGRASIVASRPGAVR